MFLRPFFLLFFVTLSLLRGPDAFDSVCISRSLMISLSHGNPFICKKSFCRKIYVSLIRVFYTFAELFLFFHPLHKLFPPLVPFRNGKFVYQFSVLPLLVFVTFRFVFFPPSQLASSAVVRFEAMHQFYRAVIIEKYLRLLRAIFMKRFSRSILGTFPLHAMVTFVFSLGFLLPFIPITRSPGRSLQPTTVVFPPVLITEGARLWRRFL